MGRTIIKVMQRGQKVAGAFTQSAALSHAKRLAGKLHRGHGLARRGDELGYDGANGWTYIISPKVQKLMFIEFLPKDSRPSRQAIPVAVDFTESEVGHVWTLYRHTDPNMPPALPYHPRHHVNAFSEDYVHDWNIDHQGRFRYASRVTDEPVWVLVEMK